MKGDFLWPIYKIEHRLILLCLLPTHLHRENANDKLGILDVLVKLKDGMYPCQYSGFYQVPRG